MQPVKNTYVQDLLVVNGGVLVCLLLIWGWARSVNAGRPLKPFQKKMIWYSFFFILGMAYLMMLGSWLHLPPVEWFIAVGVWGVSLALVLWRSHARKKRLNGRQEAVVSARSNVFTGLPFLGLLISAIMSAIEWEIVGEGQGHLWQALAWTAGIAVCIWLARQNRRASVVIALRVLLVLGAIGAIGHPSAAVMAFLGAVAVIYFLVERLWPKHTNPPVLDFETLSKDKPN